MPNLTPLHADELRARHEDTPVGATQQRGKDPYDRTMRIAPSFLELPEVTQAAAGVAVCVLLAATEKLLQSHAG